MIIVDRIKEMLSVQEDSRYNSLWSISQKIVDDVINHNKRIMSQMSNYDLHDETHSEKVIEIIEQLLGEKINALSIYELILIYLSAYIHDSAMALPEWEYNLLRAIEGTEEFYDNTLAFRICNDFKRTHTYGEALKIIKENNTDLFDFEKTNGYIFAKETEAQFYNSLAELICSYEEFRNGYIVELSTHKKSVSAYMDISQMIRSEYIRQTHHVRSAENIYTLKGIISSAIGAFYAEKFISDLSGVCECHGEDISRVFELETSRTDWVDQNSNIQFVAILLRLGDVIHFSSDRAPLSLYAEKRIDDETSFMHWNAKFQDLRFSFYRSNDLISVKYTAFCDSPEIYYFIQDYLNWVDNELDNYYSLKQGWEQRKLENLDVYSLPISNRVDRSEINYDANKFMPKDGMHFVLNQAKILELLMGVKLYKDKFLCLREIYQNSLDATKCILAYNNQKRITENLFIEFGIGEENIGGIKHKYLYCLDHGTGMNEYIINNYLLHIGNSYYKSKDFSRKNTSWGFNVVPTSQFGIGILSGYMLADKIGVTTIYYEDKKISSFVLEGVNEHFYYVQPSKIDTEYIGNHGTIVKLYLKDEYADYLNSKHVEKLPLLVGRGDNKELQNAYENTDLLNGNIGYILSNHIGVCHKDIPVYIREEAGTLRSIISGNNVLSIENYPEINKEDLERMWKDYHFLDGTPNPYKDLLENLEYIDNYVIKVVTDNIELYSHVSLPKKGIMSDNLYFYNMFDFVGKNEGSVLVDGIYVSAKSRGLDDFSHILGNDLSYSTMMNFIGEKRPVLSVDRSSYVELPNINEELELAKQKFVENLKDIVCAHVLKEKIQNNDWELHLIFDAVIKKFPSVSNVFFRLLSESQLLDAPFPDEIHSHDKLTINKIIYGKELKIEAVDFTHYKEVTRRILIGKMVAADQVCVKNCLLSISGNEYSDFPILRDYIHEDNLSISSVAIKADKWEGKYQEYDLVNTLWPVVNPCLFNSLISEYDNRDISPHCKTVSDASNGLQGIAKLDPVLINPAYGIGIKHVDRFKKQDCLIGQADNIQHSYWLFELSNHGESVSCDKKSHSLFAYIAPRILMPLEEIRLKELESTDPVYVRGVKEGWSILFLGAMEKYIICPGMVSREYIIGQIPDSFKQKDTSIQYYNTDQTKTF